MPSAYLWCPAYALATQDELAATRQRAAAFALAAGLELVESPLLARLAGPGTWLPEAERAADLRRGLAHDLLLAVRGGHGCQHLLQALPAAHPLPLLVGYSDLTVLHAWWLRCSQDRGRPAPGPGPGLLRSIYGFMPGLALGGRASASAAALLRGDGLNLDHNSLEGKSLRSGEGTGPLFAACLRVLTALAGTSAMPALAGQVLALEDIDEAPYRIDRDLCQLEAAGALAGIQGLVLGAFPCAATASCPGPDLPGVLRCWADRLGVPAVWGLPIGHHHDPIALPCGSQARLVVHGDDWTLAVQGSPCAWSTSATQGR